MLYLSISKMSKILLLHYIYLSILVTCYFAEFGWVLIKRTVTTSALYYSVHFVLLKIADLQTHNESHFQKIYIHLKFLFLILL